MESCKRIIKEISQSQSESRKSHELLMKVKRSQLLDNKKLHIDFLKAFKNFHETVLENPEFSEIELDRAFLKKELSRMGLKSKVEDFLSLISEGDVLEVYNLEGNQIFRNFDYFLYSSYEVTDLIEGTWDKLFVRDDSVNERIMSEMARVLSSDGLETIALTVPNHILSERYARGLSFEIGFKYAWPLFNRDDEKVAFLVSQRVKSLGLITFQ